MTGWRVPTAQLGIGCLFVVAAAVLYAVLVPANGPSAIVGLLIGMVAGLIGFAVGTLAGEAWERRAAR